MFCKWCGAENAGSATTCSRCKKELPAMSDCGGFYDLIAGGKQAVPEVVTPAVPEAEQESTGILGGGTPDIRKIAFFLGVMVVAFIVVVAVCIHQSSKYMSRVAALEGQVSGLQAELVSQQTEPEEQDAAVDAEQEPEEDSGEAQTIDVTIDFNPEGVAEVTGSDDKISGQQADYQPETGSGSVQIHVGDQENCITFQLESTTGSALCATFQVDETVFSQQAGEVEYTWECRPEGGEEWVAPDAAGFTVSQDGTTVTCPEDAGSTALKLTYKRAGEKENITVVVTGVYLPRKVLEPQPNNNQ